MQGMLITLAGVLLSSCTTPGFPDKNVAGPSQANVEVVVLPDDRKCTPGNIGH